MTFMGVLGHVVLMALGAAIGTVIGVFIGRVWQRRPGATSERELQELNPVGCALAERADTTDIAKL